LDICAKYLLVEVAERWKVNRSGIAARGSSVISLSLSLILSRSGARSRPQKDHYGLYIYYQRSAYRIITVFARDG